MTNNIRIFLLSLILFSCKESTINQLEFDIQGNRITYQEAQAKCEKLKEQSTYTNTEDCMCGSRLPNFNVKTISDENIKSSDLMGKLTIVNFWFTTCAPCIAEVPGFNALVEKYGNDKVNFIAIARNSKSEIEEFLVSKPWKFKHIADEHNIIDSIFNHQSSYPTTYLLDKNGVIIRSFSGGAIGEKAGYFLQKRIVYAIENALRTTPIKSRISYSSNIGDVEYNADLDDNSFLLCNSQKKIKQYFNDGSGLMYQGEKAKIYQKFRNNYKSDDFITDSGIITLRFVVNCKGETGRFRLQEMDYNYKETKFNKSIIEQIISITKSLDGWQPKKLDGTLIDYYQILSFKIENGKIIEILP